VGWFNFLHDILCVKPGKSAKDKPDSPYNVDREWVFVGVVKAPCHASARIKLSKKLTTILRERIAARQLGDKPVLPTSEPPR
jgi:hypothetical protein